MHSGSRVRRISHFQLFPYTLALRCHARAPVGIYPFAGYTSPPFGPGRGTVLTSATSVTSACVNKFTDSTSERVEWPIVKTGKVITRLSSSLDCIQAAGTHSRIGPRDTGTCSTLKTGDKAPS